MAKVRNCVWVSPSSILTIAHNLFRQFLNVTFNKIVCQLVLFLFYETPPPDLLSSILLVLLAGYFGFQVSARQLSAESVRGARFQAPEQLCNSANGSIFFELKFKFGLSCSQCSQISWFITNSAILGLASVTEISPPWEVTRA